MLGRFQGILGCQCEKWVEVEVHRDVHCHEREHGNAVGEEVPVGADPRAIGGTECCAQALEEHHDGDP